MSDEKPRPRQLGRGLEALFGEDRTNIAAAEEAVDAGARPASAAEPEAPSAPTETPVAAPAAAGSAPAAAPTESEGAAVGFRMVPIAKLIPNPLQPRRHFGDEALRDLTNSIREQGILQPLIVRPTRSEPGNFEIVAGERRWRAAQRAQVHEAPVIIRDFNDAEALAVALIENIQRDELSPLEEAEAYARLSQDFGKTQEQVAEVVGKSRSHIANMTRLLDLPEDVRALLADGALSAGHARAILRAADPAALARQIIDEGLTVRDAERLGKERRARRGRPAGGAKRTGKAKAKDTDTLALERALGNALGLHVDIAFDGNGGQLRLDYSSLEQLDDLIDRLMGRGAVGGGGEHLEFSRLNADEGAPAGPPSPSGPRDDPPWETAQRHAPDDSEPDENAVNPDRALSERPPED
ncbi:MAG: ParB/RepB/Spo0J family partition protein [Alphaproteobacteria bacterium]|nr:ParB/RepB/Spo0J family partition protein [Alphaproteobacteria bacterium]